MKRLFSLCLLFLLVPFAAAAQTVTPMPAFPTLPPQQLPFDVLVTGTLNERGARASHLFEVPPGRDVVVTYGADRIIMGRYCVRVVYEDDTTAEDCYAQGGGGDSDTAVHGRFFFTGGDRVVRTTVELVFSRPLDGAASYQLLAYALTPRPLALGNAVSAAAPPTAQPFHSYSFEANPTLPFTVTIEENVADGAFLWAAFEPYKPGLFTVWDDLRPLAQRLDSAQAPDSRSIESLDLYYLGGNRFRALVGSRTPYALRSAAVDILPLEAGEVASLTLSYRLPLKLVRLNSDGAGAISLRLEAVDGAGGVAFIYAPGIGVLGRRDLFGGGAGPVTYELPDSPAGRYVALQIPPTHTRAPVTLEVEWQRQP